MWWRSTQVARKLPSSWCSSALPVNSIEAGKGTLVAGWIACRVWLLGLDSPTLQPSREIVARCLVAPNTRFTAPKARRPSEAGPEKQTLPIDRGQFHGAPKARVARNERAKSRASELRARRIEPKSFWISSRILAPRAGLAHARAAREARNFRSTRLRE